MADENVDSPDSIFKGSKQKEKASKNVQDSVAVAPVPRFASEYNMNHPKRGYALIFNNKKFIPRQYTERVGTDVDAGNLAQTLARLRFQVSRFDDYTAQEIIAKTKEFSAMDHELMDCILITIMSHGLDKGKILGKDTAYNLDAITSLFQPDRCPSLAGKPKLFFVQACRGDQNNAGIYLNRSMKIIETDSIEEPMMGYTIPMSADFLVAYSTIPGHVSMRNIDKGAWFIQSICSELIKYGKEDILSILTFVCQRVAIEFESKNKQNDRVKQIPCFMSSLTRKLYFK